MAYQLEGQLLEVCNCNVSAPAGLGRTQTIAPASPCRPTTSRGA
jgi:hypothetical protein